MIVQIYEIQTPAEAEKCIELGVDHIGSVVLSEDEWRIPLLKETVRLSEGGGARSSLIPLFQDPDTIYRTVDYYGPGFLHLCNSLTNEDGTPVDLEPMVELQSELKKRFPEVGVIRSIPLPKEGAANPDFPFLDIARAFRFASDFFLTDTWLGREPVEGYIGITGEGVDRRMAHSLVRESTIPVILAGGLSPDNVYRSLVDVLPSGADSCTLTNAVDSRGRPIRFQKDFEKVARFVKEVRRAEKELREEKLILTRKLEGLEEDLRDREAALPAHSVRPSQMMAIEAIEDDIEAVKRELARYRGVI